MDHLHRGNLGRRLTRLTEKKSPSATDFEAPAIFIFCLCMYLQIHVERYFSIYSILIVCMSQHVPKFHDEIDEKYGEW